MNRVIKGFTAIILTGTMIFASAGATYTGGKKQEQNNGKTQYTQTEIKGGGLKKSEQTNKTIYENKPKKSNDGKDSNNNSNGLKIGINISQSDDEWSLALAAFVEAVRTYDLSKGRFLSFSELVIKRRLTDYYRSQLKFRSEITVNPGAFEGLLEDNEEDFSIQQVVLEQTPRQTKSNNKENNNETIEKS